MSQETTKTSKHTILVPVYNGVTQRDILNWIRDHSMMLGAEWAKARNIAREVVTDFYSTRRRENGALVGTGYAYPSNQALMDLTQRGKTYVGEGVAAMKTTQEWVIVSGHGGRSKAGSTGTANQYFPIIPWDQVKKGKVVDGKVTGKKDYTVEWVEKSVDAAITLPEWCNPAAFIAWRDSTDDAPVVVTPEQQEVALPADVSDIVPPVTEADAPPEFPPPPEDNDYSAPVVEPVEPDPKPQVSLPTLLSSVLTTSEQRDLLSEPQAAIKGITAYVEKLERDGYSVRRTIEVAREKQNGERTQSVSAWLKGFALRYPRQQTDQDTAASVRAALNNLPIIGEGEYGDDEPPF